jgi:uridine kinase
LAAVLEARAETVLRASIDDFHAPRSVRYGRGRSSPEGFFRDSYDYELVRKLLLDPVSPGGGRRIKRAAYDVVREVPVEAPSEVMADGTVLVVDGIFLHRPGLVSYWDYSIFLDVAFAVSVPRGAARGYGSPDPDSVENRRYVEGQKLYFAECRPLSSATIVIDNNDLENPKVTYRGGPSTSSG